MNAARTTPRPSRRSLLLSGALLGTLGLAGCDPAASEEEAVDVPPPRLTMEELVIHDSAAPTLEVLAGVYGIAPAGERRLAGLVHTKHGYADRLSAITVERGSHRAVPIDPQSISLTVDSSAPAVRVLTSIAVDGRWRTTLLTSEDLLEWTEVPLGDEVDLRIEAAGHGLIASAQDAQRIDIWAVSDDGAASDLAPLEIPEGQHWNVQGMARRADTIVLLVESNDLRSDRIPRATRSLCSTDGGSSWGELVQVADDEETSSVESLHVHGDQFVVLGGVEVQPEWSASTSYWRPTSWVSEDGASYDEVAIPLPTWGEDDWTWPEKGEVNADTEIDMEDLSWSSPLVSSEGGGMHLTVYFEDIMWRATRDADGGWRISERMVPFEGLIDAAFALPDEAIVAQPTGVSALRLEPDTTGYQTPWVAHEGVSTTAGHRLVTVSGLCGAPLSLLVQRDLRELDKAEDGTTEMVNHRDGWGFVVDGGRITPAAGIPEDAMSRDSVELRVLGPGKVLLLGVETDDEGTRRLRGHVSVDGDWVETSLDLEGSSGVWELTTIDEVHHLCIHGRRGEGDRWLSHPVVLTSTDGVEWERLGSADAIDLPADGAELGARILHVQRVGEAVIGVGSTVGEDYYYRAASFVLEGERWKALPLEGAGLGSTIISIDPAGDGSAVRVWTAGLMEEGTIDQAGGVTVHGEPTRDVWGRIMDLGDGLLVAPGELVSGDQGAGVGSCVWASRDGGESWGATVIPGSSGHFGTVHLMRDGEDLVAITGVGAAVQGHRILDPRAQLGEALADALGEGEG